MRIFQMEGLLVCRYMLLILIVLAIGSCKEDGINGKNSLIEFINEAPGTNCENGGVKIIEGLDLNNNGVLDENEVENSEFICSGIDGKDGVNSLVEVTPEPVGENCSSGGSKMTTGYDTNQNNLLDESEIISTEYICDGEDGIDGGYDKKLEIYFSTIGGQCNDTAFNILNRIEYLYDFDLRDYEGVDSIVFSAILSVTTSNTTATFELYNATNNTPISNSIISSSLKSGVRKISANIFNEMPAQRFNFAVRGKTSVKDKWAFINSPSIILYRSSVGK